MSYRGIIISKSNDDYHILNGSDRKKFDQNFNKLRMVQNYFDETFKNKVYRYYYIDGKSIAYMDFEFGIRNYMHLCGFKYKKGSKKFWSDLKIGRINFRELSVRNDETVWQKLEILDALKMLDTLNVGITNSLDGTLNLQYNLSIISAHRRIFQLILLSDKFKTGLYVPVSLRNTKTDTHRLQVPKRVVCIKCLDSNSIIVCEDDYVEKISNLKY